MANPGEPLSGRVAIVTGGGRGLGRAMALGLARAGCRVVITAAREQREIAILPGGATATGMVPDGVSEQVRASLLEADVIVKPLLWLASNASGGITGKRSVATRWRDEDAAAAIEDAGWGTT